MTRPLSNPLVVDVLVPVYKGLDCVKRCLESVIQSEQQVNHELIVINDASPDIDIEAYLVALARDGLIHLEVNDVNCGFIKSVNRGMRLHPDRDVLILNSDTVVANDWLDRMVAHAQSDAKIATITPFSNNAEISSFPRFCRPIDMDPTTVGSLDIAFKKFNNANLLEVPTGVGFCMYVSRRAISECGYFDECNFGKGYGEENDFCRRAVHAGFRNVQCQNVFVYHEGGVSFGSEKQKRVAHAMAQLDSMYPDYHRLVHEYISRDPASYTRFCVEAEQIKNSVNPRILVFTHNLGGGTEKHVKELEALLKRRCVFLILRPVTDRCMALSLGTDTDANKVVIDFAQDREIFYGLCRYIGITFCHVHHVRGLEAVIKDMLARLDRPFYVTLHDYYLLTGCPTLTNPKGQFLLDKNDRDRYSEQRGQVPLGFSAAEWRKFNLGWLQKAHKVIAPSEATARLFRDYYPGLALDTIFHPDWELDSPYPEVRISASFHERPIRVVVLGALSIEKGAETLEAVADMAMKQKRPLEFHLLGYACRPLSKSVKVHGAYHEEDLDRLIRDLTPHFIWFPCQWPETYSYTLSASLRHGLPVLAPDIGSFAERMKGRPLSELVAYPCDTKGWLVAIEEFIRRVDSQCGSPQAALSWQQEPVSRFYQRAYMIDTVTPSKDSIDWQKLFSATHNLAISNTTTAERFLVILYRLREMPLLRLLICLVPLNLQRRLKRRLSSKPMHELL